MQAVIHEPNSRMRSRLNSLLLFVVLAVLGLVANRVSLSLAFGIDFIFGSVFALLALRIFGTSLATVIAVIAASYTYVLWGHPYAWGIFTLEVLCVGGLLRTRWIHSMVVADTLYWLLLGVPLVWFSYGHLLGVPQEQVWLIAQKQALNGITNAILASLILWLIPTAWLHKILGKQVDLRIGMRELSFTLIIAIVYLSIVVMLVAQSRNIYSTVQEQVEQELQDHASDIKHYIANMGSSFDHQRLKKIFTPSDSEEGHGLVLIKANGDILLSTLTPALTRNIIQLANSNKSGESLQTWHPNRQSMPLMIWWNNSVYFVQKDIHLYGIGSIIVTNPTRAVIYKIHNYNIKSLSLLAMVLVVAMLIAMLISRVFSHTILHLVEITDDLPNKLRKGMVVAWPKSRVLELDDLSKQSSVMSNSILETFKGYETSQEELNEQVRSTTDALDENYARSSAIIEGSVEGIITTDENGNIESFNSASESMFGYAEKEIIGKKIFTLLAEPYRTTHQSYLMAYLKGAAPKVVSKRTELMAVRKDGSEFPIELSVSEIRLKDRRLFTGFISDISERKETERLKNEFVSMVSHELRTPLTAIRGAIGLLSAKESSGLSEKSRHLLNITLNNTQRLVRLINDILDIQKLEAGNMHFPLSEENLLPIVETVVEQNQSYVEQFEVSLKLSFPERDIYILTNIDRLNQVLTNLISNAAKFSPVGSVVSVAVIEDGDNVIIEVQDHGEGIPEEFRDKIFEKFSQADSSTTRRQGGTGLGLSISKGFVEQMGGSIDFRTSHEYGTVFFVRFPIKRIA